jgi:hypothetical protein
MCDSEFDPPEVTLCMIENLMLDHTIMTHSCRQNADASNQEASNPIVPNIDFDKLWNLQSSSEISVIALEVWIYHICSHMHMQIVLCYA